MPRIDLTNFRGMVTAPGMLERDPASCTDALNFEFPAPGLIRKRRGFEQLPGNAGGPVWNIMTSRELGQNVLVSMGTTATANALRFGDGTAALTPIGVVGTLAQTRNPAAGLRAQLALANRCHYVTADEGVVRLEGEAFLGANARWAGMPRGKGVHINGVTCLAGTAFAVGAARAYRITWHRRTSDGETELAGAPTARWVIANANYTNGYAGTPASFGMYVAIPREFGTLNTALDVNFFYRLWGTRTFLEASQLGDDEMYLIRESFITAPDIAAGYVNPTDNTPNSYLLSSPKLNTNLYNYPRSDVGLIQGIVNADEAPPSANDVAYWQDVMWYADIKERPALTVAMAGLPADNDTVALTANGVTVTLRFKLVPAVATDVQIVNTAPSTTINIRLTCINLMAKVNQHCTANGLDGFHVSTTSTEPGLCFFEQRALNGTPISFVPSATNWRSADGTPLSSSVVSRLAANELHFSKPLRPDAVPPVNVLTAGPSDARILRIVPFKDRLLVFTDYGIYQVTGRTFADFGVYPFDLGYRLMGRQLVAMCDEKVYAWCNEGIIEIDDGGVSVVSTPIEPTVESLLVDMGGLATNKLSAGRQVQSVVGFAVAYHNEHQVRFHYGAPDADVANNPVSARWIAFDTRTRAWARGQFSENSVDGYLDGRSAACVRWEDDLMLTGSWSTGSDTTLFRERREYKATDYTDTSRDGSDEPVGAQLAFQYQVPDAAGAVHWQQNVINWDVGTQTWRTAPTLATVYFSSEDVTLSGVSSSVTAPTTRIEAPLSLRRAQRLQVTVGHGAIEYCGLVSLSQEYRDGTRFARRVTP